MMLDFLYSVGQVACGLLVLYGAFLAACQVLPARVKVKGLDPALEDELLLLRHLHNDA